MQSSASIPPREPAKGPVPVAAGHRCKHHLDTKLRKGFALKAEDVYQLVIPGAHTGLGFQDEIAYIARLKPPLLKSAASLWRPSHAGASMFQFQVVVGGLQLVGRLSWMSPP